MFLQPNWSTLGLWLVSPTVVFLSYLPVTVSVKYLCLVLAHPMLLVLVGTGWSAGLNTSPFLFPTCHNMVQVYSSMLMFALVRTAVRTEVQPSLTNWPTLEPQ